MIRFNFAFVLASVMLLLTVNNGYSKGKTDEKGYVVISKYLKGHNLEDVSDIIQKVIDDNPNRTIYFPDGEYLIGKPILTPAEPTKSVALELSNYAIIRATDTWSSDEAMIRLGGKDPANNISIPGSNYYFSGGIIDGNKKAKGISIDGGRETIVRDCSMKNVTVGLHIKFGANSGSSDCDIHDVNIFCVKTYESIGVLIQGYDNTLTNIRISGARIGVMLTSNGNYLRNIHPLFYNSKEFYSESAGFYNKGCDNWFDFCYSDQYAVGFYNAGYRTILHNCFVYWYSPYGVQHTAIKSTGGFNDIVTNLTVGMNNHNKVERNIVLEVAKDGGRGVISNLILPNPEVISDSVYTKFINQ